MRRYPISFWKMLVSSNWFCVRKQMEGSIRLPLFGRHVYLSDRVSNRQGPGCAAIPSAAGFLFRSPKHAVTVEKLVERMASII